MKDKEIKFNENVKEAKELYNARNKNQMKVAKLALEVCEIVHGGKANSMGLFTLSRFAKESGVGAKSLSHWISVYKLVYEKADKELIHTCSFTVLQDVANTVKYDASAEQINKKIKKRISCSSIEVTVNRYLKDIRSIAYNFRVNNAGDILSKETQEELLFYCNTIVNCINKSGIAKKAQNHEIAGKSSLSTLSATTALNLLNKSEHALYVTDKFGDKFRISQKDKDIINYMKKFEDKYLTPTEIGMTVGKRGENSSTAWSHRTLNKLLSLEYVDRNKYGHYRWVGKNEKSSLSEDK